MPISDITAFGGQLPDELDPATFPARADALFLWLVQNMSPEMNAAIAGINAALNTDETVLDALTSLQDRVQTGTWTPRITDSSDTVVSSAPPTAEYIKIDAQVFIRFRISGISVGAASGNILIKDLPFLPRSGRYFGPVDIGGASVSGTRRLEANIQDWLYLLYGDDNDLMFWSNFTGTYVEGSVTYLTDDP